MRLDQQYTETKLREEGLSRARVEPPLPPMCPRPHDPSQLKPVCPWAWPVYPWRPQWRVWEG